MMLWPQQDSLVVLVPVVAVELGLEVEAVVAVLLLVVAAELVSAPPPFLRPTRGQRPRRPPTAGVESRPPIESSHSAATSRLLVWHRDSPVDRAAIAVAAGRAMADVESKQKLLVWLLLELGLDLILAQLLLLLLLLLMKLVPNRKAMEWPAQLGYTGAEGRETRGRRHAGQSWDESAPAAESWCDTKSTPDG